MFEVELGWTCILPPVTANAGNGSADHTAVTARLSPATHTERSDAA